MLRRITIYESAEPCGFGPDAASRNRVANMAATTFIGGPDRQFCVPSFCLIELVAVLVEVEVDAETGSEIENVSVEVEPEQRMLPS